MSKKMGFGAVLAIVFGSQIGSGIFVLPASLASYGLLGVYSWCFAGAGAMLLAFEFAELCSLFPRTGGPHVYVREVFGEIPGFFIGWTYWLVSWVSSSVVVIASVACLSPFFGDFQSPWLYLFLEVCLLAVIVAINCKSVELSGRIELILTLMKFVPFVIVPAVIFFSFDASNISISESCSKLPLMKSIASVTALAFWGFIGVECATAPAGAVENPSKVIPKAIILGTCCVAIIYFVNHLAIAGVVPSQILEKSKAPYIDAINVVLGKNSSLLIAVVTSIVCVGTLNAWVLTSAQISLGLAQDKLLPQIFANKNGNNTPYAGVLISCIGMIPILILTKAENLSDQITYIVDFSVKSFLIVYTVCSLAFLRLMVKAKRIFKIIIGIFSLTFCILMIAESSMQSLIIALLFTVSGVFMFPFLKHTFVSSSK